LEIRVLEIKEGLKMSDVNKKFPNMYDVWKKNTTGPEMPSWADPKWWNAQTPEYLNNYMKLVKESAEHPQAPYDPKSPTSTGVPAMDPTEKMIRDIYVSMQPEIMGNIKSAASQRGGMDSGGYYTALAKGQVSSWQDMLKALIGNSQYQQGRQDTKDLNNQNYQLLTAQAKAQEPNAWQYILSGAAAGAPFGPVGAGIGGLLGWAARQGFFK
jgi:hypothetical protein